MSSASLHAFAFRSEGELLWNSDEVEGLGTAMTVDERTGDAYVVGFTVASSSSASSPEEATTDSVVAYKVTRENYGGIVTASGTTSLA